jgi:hypothetical protein
MYLLRIHRFRINTTYNNKVNLALKTTCINQNLFKRTYIFSCHYSVFYVIWTFIKRPPVLKDHLSLSIEWSLMLRHISLFFFYQYIMMVSIIGGRNQSMWWKPVTSHFILDMFRNQTHNFSGDRHWLQRQT